MYVGHIGIALGAKGLRPRTWTPALVAAAVACDVVQMLLELAGVEDKTQTYSHSVPAALVIAGLLAALYFALTRRAPGAVFVAAVALSHLPADYIAGRKLLWPDGPEVGLLLYDHYAADFAVEAAVIALGWVAFRRTLAPRWRRSRLTWGLLATLVLGQLAFNYYDYRDDVANDRAGPWWGDVPARVVHLARVGDGAHTRSE